ncbi:MAG: hypothetical protein FWF91_06370 [Coriobacteriia bacterium]|nr:hypothetical protein [Coriobacteriia bacterium]
MKCIVCDKKLSEGETVCPVCNSNQLETVLFKGGGWFKKSKANKPACQLIITNTRLVAVDDYMATMMNSGRAAGGLVGSALGAGMGKLAGDKLMRAYVDINLSLITGLTGKNGNFLNPAYTTTVTTVDGSSYVFMTDTKSEFPEKISGVVPVR